MEVYYTKLSTYVVCHSLFYISMYVQTSICHKVKHLCYNDRLHIISLGIFVSIWGILLGSMFYVSAYTRDMDPSTQLTWYKIKAKQARQLTRDCNFQIHGIKN
jgi:hypothetical protein